MDDAARFPAVTLESAMSDRDVRHRLSAILAADAVGYSRLMAMDDVATVAALDQARAIFRATIDVQGGRVVDMAGDSVLAVFDTATGAVRAALDIQALLTGAMRDLSDDRRMRFRIGIHLGDVVEKSDGTVYGDGVNVAARLEGLADPGSVVVSHTVHSVVLGKLPVTFVDLGEQQVKNIARPQRAYRVVTPDDRPVDAPRRGPTNARRVLALALSVAMLAAVGVGLVWLKPWQRIQVAPTTSSGLSIVVLPFANLSGDPAQAYVADGLTASITSDLSRIRDAFVVSAATAQAYKDKGATLRQIGNELGVRYVLQGNVQRSGDRLRINASLGNTRDDAQLWTDSFDGDTSNLFALQDLITTRIGNSIGRAMVVNAARESEKRTTDPSAADLILRAQALYFGPRSKQATWDSLQLFQQALALDPNNLTAMSTLASLKVGYAAAFLDPKDPARETMMAEGRDMALRVRRTDADSVYAWLAIGMYAEAHGDMAGAIQAREARVALQPRNPAAYTHLAMAYVHSDPKKAIALADQAIDLDPRRADETYVAPKAEAALWSDDPDTAIALTEKLIQANPQYGMRSNQLRLAIAYQLKGDTERAKAAASAYRAAGPRDTLTSLRAEAGAQGTQRRFFDTRFAPAYRALALPE